MKKAITVKIYFKDESELEDIVTYLNELDCRLVKCPKKYYDFIEELF